MDAQRKGHSAVVRTSTRQTIFLPIPGLVDPEQLKPSDLVGTNKDSYLILEKLPEEFDSRVQAMEVDERPTEEYSDIGGCDLQIQELIEAVVLPMTHKDMFDAIGIRPPKGVLLHGALRYFTFIFAISPRDCVSIVSSFPFPLNPKFDCLHKRQVRRVLVRSVSKRSRLNSLLSTCALGLVMTLSLSHS